MKFELSDIEKTFIKRSSSPFQVVNSSSNENNGLQQVQVLPVQTTAGGQPIMLQQSSTPHVIQTADGQTLIYQPVQVRKQLFAIFSKNSPK